MTSPEESTEESARSEGSTGRGAATSLPRRALDTALAVYALGERTQIPFLAAAITYYAFVSMVPMVVIGVVVATLLGGEALADRLVTFAAGVLTPTGEGLLRSAVTARTGLGGVTLVGGVVLLWGALRAFRGLDRAFALVYGTSPPDSPLRSVGKAILTLTAVGAGLAAVVVVGAAVALLPGQFPISLGALALLPTLVVLFLPLYFLIPDVELTAREVVPGAVLAAVGWTVLGSVIQLYATLSATSLYGLLGTVLLALTWLYLGALLLLYGAALNAVRSGHARDAEAGETARLDQ